VDTLLHEISFVIVRLGDFEDFGETNIVEDAIPSSNFEKVPAALSIKSLIAKLTKYDRPKSDNAFTTRVRKIIEV